MPNFQSAFVDYYAALLLVVLLFIIVFRKDYFTFDQRVFLTMIIGTIVALLSEGITYLVNGNGGAFARVLNQGFNYVLFVVTPLLATFWANYLDIKVFRSIRRLRYLLYHHYLLIFGWTLVLVNPFYPILFQVDEDNLYQRGWGTYLIMALLMLVGLYYTLMTLFQRKSLGRRRINGLLALILLPSVGGVLQMLFYGFTSMFSMMALGLVTAYIVLENIGVNTDPLTALFTRAKVYPYLESLRQRHRPHAVILFDMDNLKDINDAFGHFAGDDALVALSATIVQEAPDDALVARMGGDEFLVVTTLTDTTDWTRRVTAIRRHLAMHSTHDVRFSWGMAVATEDTNEQVDALLHRADERMYADKARNKNQRRRRTDFEEV